MWVPFLTTTTYVRPYVVPQKGSRRNVWIPRMPHVYQKIRSLHCLPLENFKWLLSLSRTVRAWEHEAWWWWWMDGWSSSKWLSAPENQLQCQRRKSSVFFLQCFDAAHSKLSTMIDHDIQISSLWYVLTAVLIVFLSVCRVEVGLSRLLVWCFFHFYVDFAQCSDWLTPSKRFKTILILMLYYLFIHFSVHILFGFCRKNPFNRLIL